MVFKCRALPALVGLLVLCPASAHAAENRYGWCEIKTSDDGAYYMSGIVQVPRGAGDVLYALETEFANFARQSFASVSPHAAECWINYRSPTEGKSYQKTRQNVITTQEHRAFTATGWTGRYAAVEEAPEPSRSGPFLTVKTDTGAIDARKTQDAMELQAQRDQAASIAKRISDTARNRADMQAKVAKFLDELRKRGSAQ
jgi:hypothetical protein